MNVHLYFSMIPEALVASMLPPAEFGAYLATGTEKRAHGQAVFFDLFPDFQSDFFNISDIERRCVPRLDGSPKNSVYLSIYRVLEHIPLDVLGSLWLTTAHGKTLELRRTKILPDPSGRYHLYQELCPVHPLISSVLDPVQFSRFITNPAMPICLPKVCFADLKLSNLADDPVNGEAVNLPYRNIEHLRDCIIEMHQGAKQTKTVDRHSQQSIMFRCIRNGFFVGDQAQTLYYPYPTEEELTGEYYSWWHCANDSEIAHGETGI
ncbi:MAG: hypothetical protein ABIJ42_09675 [Acidobacteriota bacterium]